MQVISRVEDISRGQELLEMRFRAAEPVPIHCRITHRGSGTMGNIPDEPVRIMWLESVGLWFFPSDHRLNRYWNGFGLTRPVVGKKVSPDCEINFPRSSIDRKIAAALADDEKGQLHILHRGKINGVKKNDVKQNFCSLLVTVTDGNQQVELIHVAGLEDINLIERIAEFVRKVQGIRRRLRHGQS